MVIRIYIYIMINSSYILILFKEYLVLRMPSSGILYLTLLKLIFGTLELEHEMILIVVSNDIYHLYTVI